MLQGSGPGRYAVEDVTGSKANWFHEAAQCKSDVRALSTALEGSCRSFFSLMHCSSKSLIGNLVIKAFGAT